MRTRGGLDAASTGRAAHGLLRNAAERGSQVAVTVTGTQLGPQSPGPEE